MLLFLIPAVMLGIFVGWYIGIVLSPEVFVVAVFLVFFDFHTILLPFFIL
jgi:uncharacterized membrane protein YfcA